MPIAPVFRPVGVPVQALGEVVMTLDEFEAIRLADLQGLYQEQAAGEMGVSRATFGRILDSAHHKVAQVLVQGEVLRIEGGSVQPLRGRPFHCPRCSIEWEGPPQCPRCRRGCDEDDPWSDRPWLSEVQAVDRTKPEEKSER